MSSRDNQAANIFASNKRKFCFIYLYYTLPKLKSIFIHIPLAGMWTSDEDNRLKQLVEEHGTSNWGLIGDLFVDRTGKQCRERWTHHLCPGLKKGDWTEEVCF